jgi:riboflavin synthase
MFTGIIEEIGKIAAIRTLHGGRELDIQCSFTDTLEVDDSISVQGVCQTVVRKSGNLFTVQAVEETLRKTTFGSLKAGDEVNLERCLTLNTRLDGHIVQGHVDTTGTVKEINKEGANWLITIGFPDMWKPYIVGRGSIAVDGISLTVARDLGAAFVLAIIPYTWEHTTLHARKPGDAVNLEFDILGKYVVKFLSAGKEAPAEKLTEAMLKEMGY